MYGEQSGWSVTALEAGEGPTLALTGAKLPDWPIPPAPPLTPRPTGRPAVGWDRRPRVGSLPQGRSRILGRLWQCPGAREEPPPPTPLGPSVIRAIFSPLFLPISGLWTGLESGLSWGRGLEPLNWASAWELQPQHRPQPGAESWQGEGNGDVARPGAGPGGGVSLARLTPPWAPH